MKPELRTWDLFWPCTYFLSSAFLFYTNIFSFDISPSTNNFFANLLQEIPFRFSFHLTFFVHILRSATAKKMPERLPGRGAAPCLTHVTDATEHHREHGGRNSSVPSCNSRTERIPFLRAQWRENLHLKENDKRKRISFIRKAEQKERQLSSDYFFHTSALC